MPELRQLPTGTVTFLLSDIEGSTRLWESEARSMERALQRHDQLIAEAVAQNGGVLLKHRGEGDSTFAVFSTASGGVEAAIGAQLALSAEPWLDGIALRVRMGVHVGEVELRDGDYYGTVVNRAARLRELAHGNQIVVSQSVADLVRDTVGDGIELIDLGEHRLRDLARPERVFQIACAYLPREFPPLRSLDDYPTNLVTSATGFVGRTRLVADIASSLDVGRLTTLTGVGGVGKTRLACEVGKVALGRFRDGVWLAELAPIFEPGGVVEVLAESLGIRQRIGMTLEASVTEFVASKRILLILDNCEHLLDAVARVVSDLMRVGPRVAFLATSREGLGVVGERIIAVPSLQLPADDDSHSSDASEAMQLFVERAAAARSGFELTPDNRRDVARLCRRLDGIPLAIELAAARVRSLSPAEVADRLDERFRLLAGGPRTAVERHQTLRRAVDWSYELLDDAERRALSRLSVFAGGCDLGAAEVVLPGGVVETTAVVDLLGRLVDKSLLVAEDEGPVTRFRLLETIRSYAADRLEEFGETLDQRRRHAQYYADFAARAGSGMRGAEEVAWTARAEAEIDDLRSAAGWAVASRDADLALRILAPFAVPQTQMGASTSSWIEPTLALAAAPEHPLYPEVLAWSGWLASIAGDSALGLQRAHAGLDAAERAGVSDASMCRVLGSVAGAESQMAHGDEIGMYARRWAELARSINDDFELALALTAASVPELFGRDEAVRLLAIDEAVAVARRLGNPTALAIAAPMAGAARLPGDPEGALELFQEGLAAAESVGNVMAANSFIGAAHVQLLRGKPDEAALLLVQAAERLRRVGDYTTLRSMVTDAVIVFSEAGLLDLAAVLTGAARVVIVDAGWVTHFVPYGDVARDLRLRLGDRFDELAAVGRAMGDDEVVSVIRDGAARLHQV